MITRSDPGDRTIEPAACVQISGVDIPFRDLVRLFIKVAFASISAAIIIGFVYALVVGLIGLVWSALSGPHVI